MRKSTKLVKKLLALFLVVLISIDNFAAIVSDNDGSAFVTKAEFETMKSDFAEQIENYNESIDAKIDGAIASYLAGINLATKPNNLYDKIVSSIGGDLWMKNKVISVGQDHMDTNVKVNVLRRFNYRYYSDIVWGTKISGRTNTTECNFWFETQIKKRGNSSVDANTVLSVVGLQWNGNSGHGAAGETAIDLFGNFTGNWPSVKGSFVYTPWDSANRRNQDGTYMNVSKNTLSIGRKTTKTAATSESLGSGEAWVYHKNADGTLQLRELATSIYPVQTINIDAHTYKNFTVYPNAQDTWTVDQMLSWYATDGDRGDSTSLAITIPELRKWGYQKISEAKVVDDSESNQVWWDYTLTQLKTTDLVDYSLCQWGKNTNTAIYCLQDIAQPSVGAEKTISAAATESKYYTEVFTPKYVELGTNTLSGVEVKYKPNTFDLDSKELNSFSNSYLTTVAGENVKIGGGFPFLEVDDLDQVNRISMKFKARDIDGNAVTTDTISYQVSNKQFVNGALAPGALDYTGGIKTANVGDTVSFEVSGVKGNVWINLYSNTDYNEAAIDTISIVTA